MDAGTSQHPRPSSRPAQPHIRSFNFRVNASFLRNIYCDYLHEDSESEDCNRTSLNYSHSLLYSTAFNNTMITLCLVPEDK